MSIAGIGQAVCVTDKHLGNFRKIFKQLRHSLSSKYPYLQWYGGFCFDQRHLDADWEEFGAYRFVIPRFELASQNGKMIFCCNLVGREDIKGILRQLDKIVVPNMDSRFRGNDMVGGCGNDMKRGRGCGNDRMKRSDKPGQKLWQKNVDKVLADRSVKKVVLARKTSLYFKQTPGPWAMLR